MQIIHEWKTEMICWKCSSHHHLRSHLQSSIYKIYIKVCSQQIIVYIN